MISQYLSVKSTDILLKFEDLYGFHDEILQIRKVNKAHIQSHNHSTNNLLIYQAIAKTNYTYMMYSIKWQWHQH